jgi:DNA-binding MarR family transcriptional regulator
VTESTRHLRERRADRLAREAHLNVLVAAMRFTDELEKICQSEGISHPQYVALFVLCLSDERDTGVPMGSIADGLLNRAADTTRLIDRMEKAGLVERLRDDRDRRVVLVRATPAGAAAFDAVATKLKAYHREQWSALSSKELEQLHALLYKALWADVDDGGEVRVPTLLRVTNDRPA